MIEFIALFCLSHMDVLFSLVFRNQVEDDPSTNIRTELIKEEAKLATIRDQMVKDLIAQGINPKYLSEMRNVDIGKILKR